MNKAIMMVVTATIRSMKMKISQRKRVNPLQKESVKKLQPRKLQRNNPIIL
jgi:hypothetical protein